MQIEGELLLKLVTLVIAVGSGVYSWMNSKDRATAAQIREIEGRVAVSHDRLTRIEGDVSSKIVALESRLAHVPSKDTLHDLELNMQHLRSTIEQMKEQWTTALRSISRLEEFLLEVRSDQVEASLRERSRKPGNTRRRG